MPYLFQGQTSCVVFMFPGQGCQFYQMGRELYQNNSVFHRWMNELDTLIHAELGQSVIAGIYHDNNPRSKAFDDIRLSHPAIFMIEYALGKTLIEHRIAPDYLLGTSLGELAAAALADVISLPDAIRLVVRQGQLFHQRQSPAGEGAMLAILAEESLYQQTPLLREHCDIAAHNAPSLIVVAGPSSAVADAERHLSARDIVFQRLPVNQAFHSRHIDFLRPEVEALLRQTRLHKAQIPVISCHNTETLQQLDADHFWQTIRQPIRFSQTLARIEREAAERGESMIYLDLGPSGTLANLIKQNIRDRALPPIFPVLSPFGRDLEKFDEVLTLGRALQPLPAKSALTTPPTAAPAQVTAPPATFQVQQPTRLVQRPSTPMPSGPKRVYGFPGQGSQRLGMGAALFEQFPEHLAEADKILGYSLKTLCLEDPDQQLSNTRFTQPALYTVSALAFLAKQQADPRKADFLAGHSLGEYCALFAAGAFSFETGLKLVKKRGELMALATGGSMAAVIGRSPDEVNELLARHGLGALDVANYNSPSQVVLAGPVEALSEAKEIFQAMDITFVALPVSAPFHSRYMKGAMGAFGEYLVTFEYSPLHTPVIANIDAAPYRDDQLVDNLTRQICGSVRWLDTVQYLMRQGSFEFEELGPGEVLTKLVKTVRNAAAFS
ncbi:MULTISPECIES: ACP S-malonyltransferase [Gammaproteobacteria]|uniref:ACP S-malonyltransferase n=1 Tax=Gammaproteobacteria TaxID=1236 RepID=UPI001914607A|nr:MULTISPECIES: ACP S-malonyltransferase [Gammaproteobacteria]MBK5304147.1 ACP S-malonyltransferase [Bacillus sp. TH86]MBK5323916.1 ACP S-malonyltransferase [Bacillus sp. TH59]MBK5338866.1 ACP S-malonyltransferase [Bacillus sp. TH57]MBK5312917.1 ACP S-malonyltransferase [Pseudomonas sp. TH71]MBK5318414.1 ACP S-malonyltransferase [Erwinia sp. TH79]